MSARFSGWSLGACLVAQLIGSGVSISCAAESAPSDGFEKVRKELEATKNTRTPAAQPTAGLSSSALPDWRGAATVPPPTPTPVRKTSEGETKIKSSNWLVEAMSQGSPSLGSSGTADIRARTGDDSRVLAEKNTARRVGEEKGIAGADIRELKPLAGQPVAPDPFGRFMGGWMTPQDYALLKPVAVGEPVPRDASRETGRVAPSLNTRTPELSISIRTSGGGESAKKNVPVPRENPYLQALAAPGVTPSPALAAPKPPIISPSRSVAPPNPIQPTATAPPPLKPPDFPPLSDDEKYFKQLKRF